MRIAVPGGSDIALVTGGMSVTVILSAVGLAEAISVVAGCCATASAAQNANAAMRETRFMLLLLGRSVKHPRIVEQLQKVSENHTEQCHWWDALR
jgi:hypothetical protein